MPPADRSALVQELKGTPSPARRLVLSAQYAMILASEGKFRDALDFADDCLDLLDQEKRSSENLPYYRLLKLPVLYAWRQSLAAGKPADAVAIDRAVAQLLVLVTYELRQPEKPGKSSPPDPPDLATCWLTARCIEYRLTRESAVPRGFAPLLTVAVRQKPDHVPWQKALRERIESLKATLAANAPLADAQRQQLLRGRNGQFFKLLVADRGVEYLGAHKGLLCEARLPADYAVRVAGEEGPSLGALLDAMSQRVEENIRRGEKCLALKSEAAQAEARAKQLKEYAAAVKKLDPAEVTRPPDVPASLDPQLAARLAKSHALLGDKVQAAAAARTKLENAKKAEAATIAELKAGYDKALGPKRLVIRNKTDTPQLCRIAFWHNGTWHNEDLRASWTVAPGATIRPDYQGKPIICSQCKIFRYPPRITWTPLLSLVPSYLLGKKDISLPDDQAEECVVDVP